ncbi:MAG: double zinc ribbon domain-containing protein [Paracoccaceae bacterium]
MGLQSALRLIYPPSCISCDTQLDEEFALCSTCWRDTPFISGLVCDTCGVPLPGESDGHNEICDDCMTIARPWDRGRAALLYAGNARRLVLALKHGDRQDLAVPAASWLMAGLREIRTKNETVIVPVPAHWTRLISRRYNQAALLAKEVAGLAGLPYLPDGLVRRKATKKQDGMGRDARFANLANTIFPHQKRGDQITGKEVVLVDDVMTSGATLAAAAEACYGAGATRVCILALARVAKDD